MAKKHLLERNVLTKDNVMLTEFIEEFKSIPCIINRKHNICYINGELEINFINKIEIMGFYI